MGAGRRGREGDRPAARARKPRQRRLGDGPHDLHVDDLRPALPRRLRAVQAGLAAAALRRRGRLLPLAGVRVPGQALPGMAGLPAPPAVLAALPLGLLPRPPCLLSPDALLRTRRPRVGAVHPQPALQLSQPQLEPPLTLPRRVKARPQRRDLPVRQQPPKPRVRSPQPGGVISSELIGHAPQASTAAAADQIDARRTGPQRERGGKSPDAPQSLRQPLPRQRHT
jgi:hypothetical protein